MVRVERRVIGVSVRTACGRRAKRTTRTNPCPRAYLQTDPLELDISSTGCSVEYGTPWDSGTVDLCLAASRSGVVVR